MYNTMTNHPEDVYTPKSYGSVFKAEVNDIPKAEVNDIPKAEVKEYAQEVKEKLKVKHEPLEGIQEDGETKRVVE